MKTQRPPFLLAVTTALVLAGVAAPASAIGDTEADAAFRGYNAAFLSPLGADAFFKESFTVADKDYFWCQALDIQAIEDYWERTKSADAATEISHLLNAFFVQNGKNGDNTDWTWNDYNDDLLWATLAFVRGYGITHNPAYLDQARRGFDLAYSRGWDSQLGGGLWWDVKHQFKSPLSNSPAVIAAAYLFEYTQDQSYLDKATQIFEWERNHLYDQGSGVVWGQVNPDGSVDKTSAVFHMGAFIGAANHLHRLTGNATYYDDAKRSIDRVRSDMTAGGILTNGTRNGTWASEFFRGMGEFVRDNNAWDEYYDWMEQNAQSAWSHRRTDFAITWNDWLAATPGDNSVSALETASALVAYAVTPPRNPGFKDGAVYRLTPAIQATSALQVLDHPTADGARIGISTWKSAKNQKFKLTAVGHGYYRLTPAVDPTRSLDDTGNSTAAGTYLELWGNNDSPAQSWKIVYDGRGRFKLKPKAAPANCANVEGGHTDDGTRVLLWPESNADNERWVLKKVKVKGGAAE